MLLSRVAESLYWINRYLERAENISRFVEVSEAMSLDCPPGSAEPWLPLIDASSDREFFDKRFPEKKPDDVINFLIREVFQTQYYWQRLRLKYLTSNQKICLIYSYNL